MKESSIEWLKHTFEELGNQEQLILTWAEFDNIIVQLQKIHRNEIEDAHIEGQRVFDSHHHTQWTTDQAEIYYDRTFNPKK